MREIQYNQYGGKVVYEASNSLIAFNNEAESIEWIMVSMYVQGEISDKYSDDAQQTLLDLFDDPKNKISTKIVENLGKVKVSDIIHMSTFERTFCQMAYVRIVDNFQSYLKDILSEIVKKKPRVFSNSKDQETLEFILKHSSLDELVGAILEKKIEGLFYRGINDIEIFFSKTLKIDLFKKEQTKNDINLLIKQRNLLVHNRGKISKTFAEEFIDLKFEVGRYLHFSYEQISNIAKFLYEIVLELDIELCNKYKLDIIDVKKQAETLIPKTE